MIYLDWLLTVFAMILLVPTLVVFIQVIVACVPKKVVPKEIIGLFNDHNVAVLIPAHNESLGILATLDSIKAQLKSSDRLLVIADNCTDDTAKIALDNGAEVIERQDVTRRGKGYALAFGVRHLSQNPPDVVVIIDADCLVEINALKQIVGCAIHSGRPVQALYLMYTKMADIKSKVAEFAWCVKNWVRPLGYAKLGLPCQLMGTGMAFPWRAIVNADLANGNIVEDMKLGIDLAISGTPPAFYSSAKVISYFPIASEVQSGQRARWEHGHLSMILSEVPKLLAQGFVKLDKNLLAMALDLSVPPLALLVTLIFGYAMLVVAILATFHIGYLAFQLTLAGIFLLSISIGTAWWGWGRSIISFSTLMMVPVYVISKIPHYFRFLFKRQKTWNKTERD